MAEFKVRMIRVFNDPISMAYAGYCKESWEGFDFRMHDAVTPATLGEQSGLTFANRSNGRPLTDTEKACFYSQYNLWKKCAIENVPILIVEHDGYLEKPQQITFDPRFDVTFYGQHSMEAVMYHPRFADRLIRYCNNNPVQGPMNLVDKLVGYLNPGTQSRHARPHARFIGKQAPVRSVLDPNLGTSVDHDGSTADRLKKDADLFKIVDLTKSGHYTGK